MCISSSCIPSSCIPGAAFRAHSRRAPSQAIHAACANLQHETASWLAGAGADLGAADSLGKLPADYAEEGAREVWVAEHRLSYALGDAGAEGSPPHDAELRTRQERATSLLRWLREERAAAKLSEQGIQL